MIDQFNYKYTGIRRQSTIKTEKHQVCDLLESIDLTIDSYTITDLTAIIENIGKKYQDKKNDIRLRIEGKSVADKYDLDLSLNVYQLRLETDEEYRIRINRPRPPLKIKENNIVKEFWGELQKICDRKKSKDKPAKEFILSRITNWLFKRKKS